MEVVSSVSKDTIFHSFPCINTSIDICTFQVLAAPRYSMNTCPLRQQALPNQRQNNEYGLIHRTGFPRQAGILRYSGSRDMVNYLYNTQYLQCCMCYLLTSTWEVGGALGLGCL